ncbi:hypothetical protein TNCV_227101 [Trichonephila clavipes]|nr:hypothetical protein TNCV_227101 [Trichonephila clavipes]
MAPHRPKKSAPVEYTTDEEDMIVFDVEDELEWNPDYVRKDGKTYYKGSLLLTPTRHRKWRLGKKMKSTAGGNCNGLERAMSLVILEIQLQVHLPDAE